MNQHGERAGTACPEKLGRYTRIHAGGLGFVSFFVMRDDRRVSGLGLKRTIYGYDSTAIGLILINFNNFLH